jgi:hypothetical protein
VNAYMPQITMLGGEHAKDSCSVVGWMQEGAVCCICCTQQSLSRLYCRHSATAPSHFVQRCCINAHAVAVTPMVIIISFE